MLTRETISSLINCDLPEETIRQLLVDLSGDKIDLEIFTAFIDSIRDSAGHSSAVSIDAIDCSGTGGSGLAHFNTSTTVAFILAAGGVKVAKFGNRSARSSSGSFDFLEALGIPISIPKDAVHDLLDETGVVFLFAPNYYPTLGKLAAIRRSLPKSSIFNAIGPLLHPFNPTKRLMGTSDPTVYKLAGQYLRSDRFTETAIIVRAESGLDEFDPTSRSRYVEVNAAVAADEKTIEPSRLPAPHAVAMTAVNNHDIFHQLLSGEGDDYYRDLVCLNAGAGFKIDGKVSSIEDGMILARELLNSGAVADKFARCRRAYAKFTD